MDLSELAKEIPIWNQLSEDAQTLILQVILLVIVTVLIYALRKVISWVILRPIRIVVKRTSNLTDDQIFDALITPIRLVIIGLGFSLAVGLLDFGEPTRIFSVHLSRSFIIAALILALNGIIDVIALTPNTLLQVTGLSIQERLLPFVRVVTKIFIFVIGGLIIIQEWEYDVGGLIASLGIVGLAFSLAAQDTAGNIFGFTAIVSDNPFDVGDFVQTPDVTGTVEHVGIRSTRIRQIDQGLATVPNSNLTNATIVNYSRLHMRRLDMTLGITYGAKSKQLEELIQQIRQLLIDQLYVINDSIIVHFVNFGDSALEIRIICNIRRAGWADFTAEQEKINLKIMDTVEEMGLSVAFPSRSIYLETAPALPSLSDDTPAENDQEIESG